MANEEQTPMATIFGFAEKYLKRPLTQVERQVRRRAPGRCHQPVARLPSGKSFTG